MEEIDFNYALDRLKQNKLTPYNFYDIDVSVSQYLSKEHYLTHEYDTIDESQIINKCFLDIEIFQYHKKGNSISELVNSGEYPINAISFYFTSEKKYYLYVVLPKGKNITAEQIREHCLNESRKKFFIRHDEKKGEDIYESYVDEDQDLEVRIFDGKGPELTIALWEKIKENDPACLSSFNGDNFDYPYMYNHLLYHLGDHDKVAKVMSKFGVLNISPGRDRAGNPIKRIKFSEFVLMDMLTLYKTRDDGGMGLGQKLSSYKLHNIAEKEIGITKYEYAADGYTGFDDFYEGDPLNFYLYNLWDTALIVKLDQKMGMIDLYNMQRRKMRVSLENAMFGSAILYDTFLYSELNKQNKHVRFDISNERSFSISKEYVDKYLKPAGSKKITWNVTEVDQKSISTAINRFSGAYVKNPISGIYSDGYICDFDAARLYPSCILQNNVGINSFYGRILSPFLDKTFATLEKKCGKDAHKDASFMEKLSLFIFEVVEKFVENINEDVEEEFKENKENKFKNKNEAKQYYYYSILYLFEKVLASGYTLQELMNPTTVKMCYISKTYFNSLLELIEITHPREKEYNLLAYQYIINNKDLDCPIYILENFNNPTYRIIKLDGKDLTDYLKKNNLLITMSGTLFYRHDKELSILYDFLNELYVLRKKYKKQRNQYREGSFEYLEFERRQLVTKVLMNTAYGLMGMSAFRFSNKWLAKSITSSGRLSLKSCQYFAEEYIRQVILGGK